MNRRSLVAIALAGAFAIGGGIAALLWSGGDAPSPPQETAAPKAQGVRLYCQFYVFVEQRPRVGFLFDVEGAAGKGTTYRQRYVAEDNGQRQDYDGDDRPEWTLDETVQPVRIVSKITVPDSSQAAQHEEDIAIELYKYEPNRDSPTYFEASLKNIHFQNLPGKCRQSAAAG